MDYCIAADVMPWEMLKQHARCIQENRILRRLVPEAIEQNDGLFVALNDEDVDFSIQFLEACEQAEVLTNVLTPPSGL